jgi:NADH-quinone oxidoreductase subunit F
MDLLAIRDPATTDEIDAIDAVLGKSGGPEPPMGLHEATERRHLLLPAFHAAQRRCGYVSRGALGYISRRLHVPPAEAYGVLSFYALLSPEPRPRIVVHVCDDIACKAKGADALIAGLYDCVREGAAWTRSPCLGLCEHAPAALVARAGEHPFERGFPATRERIAAAMNTGASEGTPRAVFHQKRDDLRLLRRAGVVDPASLDDYRSHGGYRALRRALEIGPSNVIREVSESNLVGRGGAAFPTGRKWAAVASQPVRPHYVVCNADESEPGTFKDRILMEEDPFAIVEAMTIAGFASGSERGYLYIRGEYPLATERMQAAIEVARARGFLGADVMGRGVAFEIEIRRGAGAYICGEETALFNSIEGFRGEPRNKPPFPVEVGLFRKPTVVNNVETLVNVLDIVTEGGRAFAGVGTPVSAGTKLFCVSGHVDRPGLYEIPLGTPLAELIDMAGARRVQTVLLGGAAGTFLSPSELSVRLTFEDTRKIGATLGSGVVLVLDESVDLLPYLRRLAEFFRDESCGQCVPCRVGTVRVEELLARLARNRPAGSMAEERTLLVELGQAMRDASICGLGQTATSAIESALGKLPVLGTGATP